MKGKAVFTPEEATLIKTTIDACREAGRYSNQDLRDTLRKVYKFYISDFDRSGEGFTSADFDRQVLIGNIKIEEEPYEALLDALVNFDYESDEAKAKLKDLKKRAANHTFISNDHKQLVLLMLKEVKKRIPEITLN